MPGTLVTHEDLAKLRRDILAETAPASLIPDVASLTKWKRILGSDMSIGRLLTGPQHIDTVSIDGGAITAEKLEAQLVLSTAIIAGAVSPADRIEITAAGINAYGTVSGTPNTNTFSLQTDGDFTFGVSPQITFVASTGVLSVPAAVITSLTIARVGAGVIPANYDTSSSNPKLRLGPGGIEMFNGAGTRTIYLQGSTGSFEISNDPAGSNRLYITNDSIQMWKGGTQQFKLDGSGITNTITMLLTGPGAGEYIGLNPTNGIWTGASTFASGPFRVTPAGALTATSATITGAVTATSGDFSNVTVSGTMTISGSGLFRTANATSRVELDSTGLYGYNTGTKRFQVLATGDGFLGASTTLSWSTAGVVTLSGFTANSTTLSSGSGGSFVTMSSGATSFSAGGATPASAPFNVTSAGALTATSGAIGGWTIDSTNGLKLGTTTTTRGIATGSTAFYAGDATPGSAPFRVTTAGAVTMTNATVTGSVTASTLTITGSATFSGGSLTLPNGGTITSSTIDINGNGAGAGTFGNMDIDGTVTLASGGKIVDADGSFWDQNGITLIGTGSIGDSVYWKYSTWAANRPYSWIESQNSSTIAYWSTRSRYGNGSAYSWGTNANYTAQANNSTIELTAFDGSGNDSALIMTSGTSGAGSLWQAYNYGRLVMDLRYTNRGAAFYGRIFPGPDTGSAQTSRYLDDDGTYMRLTTTRLRITGDSGEPGLWFDNISNAGSTSAWSTNGPGTANVAVVGTSYFKIRIGGTLYRVPFWSDS
jgi:hypothetical protein